MCCYQYSYTIRESIWIYRFGRVFETIATNFKHLQFISSSLMAYFRWSGLFPHDQDHVYSIHMVVKYSDLM